MPRKSLGLHAKSLGLCGGPNDCSGKARLTAQNLGAAGSRGTARIKQSIGKVGDEFTVKTSRVKNIFKRKR